MMDEKDIELAEKYLSGSLSQEESRQVETRLAREADFKRRVDMMRELSNIYSREAEDFRELMANAHQEYAAKRQPSAAKGYWLVAASLGLLLMTAAYFLFFNNSTDPQQLYAENFSLPADNLTVRSELPEQELINAAMGKYNQGQHQQASVLFAQALEAQPDSIPILFYSAVNHMVLEDMEQAISQFQQLIAQGNSSYLIPAQWYLALAYLHTHQKSKAEEILNVLQNSSSSYASTAEQLLEEFN